jgi:hypothetical protein
MALAEGSLVLALLDRLQLTSKDHKVRIGVSGTRQEDNEDHRTF